MNYDTPKSTYSNNAMHHMQIISTAFHLSAIAHRGQKRVDGTDYIEHPIEVANNLIRVGIVDADILAAAYLHDALEKGPKHMRKTIENQLGHNIVLLVDSLTDDQRLSSSHRKAQQLERAPTMPILAKQIKLADRIANLRSPRPDWNDAKRQTYAEHSHALLFALKGSHDVLESQLQQRLNSPEWRV